MKNKAFLTLFSFLLFSTFGFSQYNDDYQSLGLPGDNLNLYATLKLFQESETLELFEKRLNDEESKINNLDLNGDNQIDYIRVIDNIDNNVHFITLQIAVSNTENQDVAVIVVQRENDKVQIQVIGDENLYGKDYIIEPNFTDENAGTPNPGYVNNNSNNNGNTIVVNQYTTSELNNWPVVRYIYAPIYRPWHSQWYWGYYPSYWHSWNPYYYHYYWGYHYHLNNYYYGNYRHSHQPRYSRFNEYYGHRRSNSVVVQKRKEKGEFRTTYSRPDMAEKGSESFKKRYPDSPSSKQRLPDVKNSGNQNNNINKRNDVQNNSIDKRNDNQNTIKSNNKNYPKPENQNKSNYNNQIRSNDKPNISQPNNIKKQPTNNPIISRPDNNKKQPTNNPNNSYKPNKPENKQNTNPPASKQQNNQKNTIKKETDRKR